MKHKAKQEKRYFDGRLRGKDFAGISNKMKRKRDQKTAGYFAKKIMRNYANKVKYGKKNPM